MALLQIVYLLTPYVAGSSLRSVDAALLVVPRSRLVTKGNQAFAVRAFRLWNSPSIEIRQGNMDNILSKTTSISPFLKCFFIEFLK